MSPASALGPEQMAMFLRDGYVIARQIFNPTERATLQAAARRIQAKARQGRLTGSRSWTSGVLEDVAEDQSRRALSLWGINEITRPALFERDLIEVFAHEAIDTTLQALLGSGPRAWGIKLLWDPGLVPYELNWHRDLGDLTLYDYIQFKPEPQDHVQFNAALEQDRCFLVVPGSHRRALSQDEWAQVRSQGTAPLPGEVVADLEPGDVLFMDAHTLHRGRCELGISRLTLHYSAQAAWVPARPWGDPAHFAWITSDRFIDRLSARTQSYYRPLRLAKPRADGPDHLTAAALAHGWRAPVAVDSAPAYGDV